MIQPEPTWAADLSGLQPGEAAVNVPLPAAGRLGVIEEKCSTPFEESHWMPGFATLGGLPCEHCGATV